VLRHWRSGAPLSAVHQWKSRCGLRNQNHVARGLCQGLLHWRAALFVCSFFLLSSALDSTTLVGIYSSPAQTFIPPHRVSSFFCMYCRSGDRRKSGATELHRPITRCSSSEYLMLYLKFQTYEETITIGVALIFNSHREKTRESTVFLGPNGRSNEMSYIPYLRA